MIKLNKQQEEVKMHVAGPLLVAAVPGSGKTRCIVERIKYLIDNKVDRNKILAVTFTNKAAAEMRTRLEAEGYSIGQATICTFHALCTQILRKCGSILGFSDNFAIYDDKEQASLVKQVVREIAVPTNASDDDEIKTMDVDVMLKVIEIIKNNLHGPEFIQDNYTEDQIKAFELYQQRLKLQNAIDFTGLLYNTYELFKSNKEVAQYYSKKWQHILVDEVQDTNKAQYEILKQLTSVHKNAILVGDIDQSIYSFRCANPQGIQDFIKEFSPKIIKLEMNYRSTPEILEIAQKLISNNTDRIKTHLKTENKHGTPVEYIEAIDNKAESKTISNMIRKLMSEYGYKYSDFTILYRTNVISHEFEEMCRLNEFPYKVYGGFGFYDRREVKACLSYMKFIANPKDILAFNACISEPKRGVGDVCQINITKEAFSTGNNILDICGNPPTTGKHKITKKQAEELKTFKQIFDINWSDTTKDIRKVIERSGLLNSLTLSDKAKGENRLDNVLELLNSFEYWCAQREKPKLADYLQEIQLMSNEEEEVDDNHIRLMTIHAAKGLEFPVVFIVGMEEGTLPHKMALAESGPEEERRLAYVAITRAMKHLFLTRAKTRFLHGEMKKTTASRFLFEVGLAEPEPEEDEEDDYGMDEFSE